MVQVGSWVLGSGSAWMTVLSVSAEHALCAGRDGGRRFFRSVRIDSLTVHGTVSAEAVAELRSEYERG